MSALRILAIVVYVLPAASATYLSPSGSLPFFGMEIASRWLVFLLWASGATLICVSSTRLMQRIGTAIIAAGVLTGIFLFNVLLAASLYVQGEGFNERFFWHLNLGNLDTALSTLRPLVLLVLVGVAMLLLLLYATHRSASRDANRALGLAGMFAGLALIIPMHSFASFAAGGGYETPFDDSRYADEISVLRWSDIDRISATQQGRKANLVMIFLESVEAGYFDEARFPGLLPNLHALKKRSIFFGNRIQVLGTDSTIGGIASAMCGFPALVGGYSNNIFDRYGDVFSRILCLPEILSALGYKTAYLGGADLEFAGKGKFLSLNGFEHVEGKSELVASLGSDRPELSKWGFYDKDLLAIAEKFAAEMSRDEAPFMLTLLTLDTHGPDGFPSPGCQPYDRENNPILHAVHCTDQLVGQFVSALSAVEDDRPTQIVVLNDHLAMRNTAIDRLAADQRSSFMMFLGTGRQEHVFKQEFTSFDIAPTVLSFLGMNDVRMGFGRDVSLGSTGLVSALDITNDELSSMRFAMKKGAAVLSDGVAVDSVRNVFFLGNREIAMEPEMLFQPRVLEINFQPNSDFEPQIATYLIDEFHRTPMQRHLSFLFSNNTLCIRDDLCPTPPFIFFGNPADGPYILREGGQHLSISGDDLAAYLGKHPPPTFSSEELADAIEAIRASSE